MGCLPVFALLAMAPKNRAHAQFSDIFGGLTSTITGIGTIISGINTSRSTLQNLENTVVHPLNDLANIQNNGLSIISGYRNWMGSVYAMPTNSAQTVTARALENQLLSGANNTSPNPQLGSVYVNTFGALPTSAQSTTPTMQAVDMGDASAQDSMQLSVLADSTATVTIHEANSLESQAMVTSAGSAPQIEATALAYEVGTLAVEHKILASQLRAAAAHLAYQGAGVKRRATTTGNALPAIIRGLK
jgi:hypothetical protein